MFSLPFLVPTASEYPLPKAQIVSLKSGVAPLRATRKLQVPNDQRRKQQEGQIVDGRYRLVLYLGGSDHSAVFLTELPNTRERAAIKLIGSDPAETDSRLSRLRRAAKLSHPHLARILEIGQAQIGSAHVVYLVTDYAEEDLSLILPDRALSPEEVAKCCP